MSQIANFSYIISSFCKCRGYGKAGNGNEMETETEMEMEMEMGNKKPITAWWNVFFIVCLVVFYLAMVYRTGFMCHVVSLYSCTVLCDYCF